MDRREDDELHALVVRLADGDRRAFPPVFEALHPVVYRWCRRLLQNDVDAEDASQVALERFFFKADEFDPAKSVIGWVLAIATAECRSLVRQRSRRREASVESLTTLGVENDAEQNLAREELRAALAGVFETMKTEDVETMLAAVEERPRPAVPASTFRKRVERALGRLRAAWKARYELD